MLDVQWILSGVNLAVHIVEGHRIECDRIIASVELLVRIETHLLLLQNYIVLNVLSLLGLRWATIDHYANGSFKFLVFLFATGATFTAMASVRNTTIRPS